MKTLIKNIQTKFIKFGIATAATGTLFIAGMMPAMAHGEVSWSVSVGLPIVAPRVIRQTYYEEPAVTYVRPERVYVRPAPVVVYSENSYPGYPRPYYSENVHYRHDHRHWRHYDDRDYDDYAHWHRSSYR